ncbi:MAG TPA: phosphoketolase family protein [Candidatus Eremiobacteraceae bacterium]|nr:phosphoketolase family protein [Candidatus Eremiobacteraceae bacterium]
MIAAGAERVRRESGTFDASAYFRAANYIGAVQLYLQDNVLLRAPLTKAHIKPRLLGHWGTQPGINLIWAHLNRMARDPNQSILPIIGPGHGAPAVNANLFLDGTLGDYYPQYVRTEAGLRNLARAFSHPSGLPSHVGPAIPGSIHEGGELGYCLAHAFGAVLDNPDMTAVCVIGDGEAETGPLAASWQAHRFVNPATSGTVLPILHLNGYKLSGPTIFGRVSGLQLHEYLHGCGYEIRVVEPRTEMNAHVMMDAALDWAFGQIAAIREAARAGQLPERSCWPAIVLRTPKGWTGPRVVDGKQVEGTSRAHQLPIADPAHNPEHLALLENWLRSYDPDTLFDADGTPSHAVTRACPSGAARLGMHPIVTGPVPPPLTLPDVDANAIQIGEPGCASAESTRVLGGYLREVFLKNAAAANFRLFSPDETTSNRLDPVFAATERAFMLPLTTEDEHFARDGRVIEILSEHVCEGLLEGYALSGRYGMHACYEGFAPIVDSMIAQHAKWLKSSREVEWRLPVPSLNILLTSHAWRQEHNGYSHQGPGSIDNLISKKGGIVRIYFPPDANSLLVVGEHCLQSKNEINLIIASKHQAPQWLAIDDARRNFAAGASVWEWAGTESAAGSSPDVILAAAGDVPAEETIAAAALLKKHVPSLCTRVVIVMDLFALTPRATHPHGLEFADFARTFGSAEPVVFAFHGYPRVIHELVHGRENAQRFHVRGYIEEGATTTPFDMLVLNRMSRFHLALEALRRTNLAAEGSQEAFEFFTERLEAHHKYIADNGIDMPEVASWR